MKLLFFACAFLVATGARPAAGQSDVAELAEPPLRVGVSERPPFAMRSGPDGDWHGLSVELWRRAADALHVDFVWVEAEPDELRSRLESGDVDVALTLVASSDGEAGLDFAPIHYVGSLVIAESREETLTAILGRVFSSRFLRLAAGVAVLLLIVGIFIWLLERGRNEGQFDRGARAGIWSGFWWAGVTMTTIGYGDKAPLTAGGRILALVWMLAAMAITASLTASVTSVLLPGDGGAALEVPSELHGRELGAVDGSPATSYLEDEGLDFRTFAAPSAGLDALRSGEIELLVASHARLRHALSDSRGALLRVRAIPAEPQRYAFAVSEDSALVEPLARSVLARREDPSWPGVVGQYVPRSR